MVLPGCCYAFAMVLPWFAYGFIMVCQGLTLVVLWLSLWYCHCFAMVLLWRVLLYVMVCIVCYVVWAHCFAMAYHVVLLSRCHCVAMVCYDIAMVWSWYCHGFAMVLLWRCHGLLWFCYGLHYGSCGFANGSAIVLPWFATGLLWFGQARNPWSMAKGSKTWQVLEPPTPAGAWASSTCKWWKLLEPSSEHLQVLMAQAPASCYRQFFPVTISDLHCGHRILRKTLIYTLMVSTIFQASRILWNSVSAMTISDLHCGHRISQNPGGLKKIVDTMMV